MRYCIHKHILSQLYKLTISIYRDMLLTDFSQIIVAETGIRFCKPDPPAHVHCNIILTLMIKNEEMIIERCLSHCIPHVDGICILDTGSTDNTVLICEQFLAKSGKPFRIYTEPFKNFGYNRTISFCKTQLFCMELKWDPCNTYAFAVDADMIIIPSENFRLFDMKSDGYNIYQVTPTLQYRNTRLMRCSYTWKCIGSTHEYWNGPTETIPYEIIHIDDKNDGGCKSDKFERDVRFLSDDILENPKNTRAYFYLGRSLSALGKHQSAIINFKNVIKINGWQEEVWYSYYEIGKSWDALKDENKMELWMNKAFEYRPTRSEPIYYLCRYFRIKGDHYKSYHYYLKGKSILYPLNDVLFIENNVYNGLFDYEQTIVSYYVCEKSRYSALCDQITYINKSLPHHIENVWSNMHYNIDTLTGPMYRGIWTGYDFQNYDIYSLSLCALLSRNDGTFLLNVRYINYKIIEHGGYIINSYDGHVSTINKMVILDSNYIPIASPLSMSEILPQIYNSNIKGMEDIRLFTFKNMIYFSCSIKNMNPHGRIEIAVGQYDIKEHKLYNVTAIEPHHLSKCEKNWIFVPEQNLLNNTEAMNRMNFIYKWFPLEIGSVQDDNKLHIHTIYNTPPFFSRLCGSSNLCEYDNKIWCVVHFVKYSTPRVYYHSIIQLNCKSMKPEKYTPPFLFSQKGY